MTSNDLARAGSPVEHLCSRHSNLNSLLVRVGDGDREAFASLYDEMSPTIYGMSLSSGLDPARASQATLDVFLRAWQQAGTYELAGQSAWTWVCALAPSTDRRHSHV
jgi:RNA polymerase sigma-70 factor (ECF subfamily)